MRLILALALACSLPAFAENQLTERDRQILVQQQQMREAQLAQARARCIEQRGVDCVTEQGLQEWMLLERSREAAVLDNVRSQPSSGSGATTPAPAR